MRQLVFPKPSLLLSKDTRSRWFRKFYCNSKEQIDFSNATLHRRKKRKKEMLTSPFYEANITLILILDKLV